MLQAKAHQVLQDPDGSLEEKRELLAAVGLSRKLDELPLGQSNAHVASHAKAVFFMEAGNWAGATQAFSEALSNARGAACAKEAQYLASVRLLNCEVSLVLWFMQMTR